MIPVLGGVVVAGATGILAYSVGFAQDIAKEIQYISTTQDFWGGIWSLYNNASAVCGKCVIPGFIAGQFLTYKLKKSVTSFFK